jgi:CRP/FNR family transcriptional regulator
VTAIAAHDFLMFLQDYPQAALEATRCILKEYQLVLRDIRRLALPETVAGRLAYLLLDWLNRRCQSGQTLACYNVGLTHGEIAAMTGTSRETISRILQQFQREKLISIHGSSLTVLRRKALEQLAS